MVDRIKKIISSVIFVFLLIGAIAKCADVLEYKEARKKYTPFYESTTNFDVIFLGTSHMWNHVLPMEMWKSEGIASYNWGYSNCTPAENYYLLQDIVKYTSPKVVVIDVYGLTEYNGYENGKYKTDRIEQQHVQFDSLPIWSKSKYAASKDVFDNYASNEDFVWNFIMYHNRWTELGKDDFDYSFTTEKGARFLTGLGETSYNPIPETEKTEIKSVCYSYYIGIIEYCQKQNIQVLCAYVPFAASEKQQRIANTIGDIVEEYPNCHYVNMLNQGILDFSTDVCPDNGHLNYSGALKVTKWLGSYLSDMYSLDNYSNHVSWQDDYQKYYEFKVDRLMEQNILPAYLVQLIDSDFSAELSFYNANLYNSERLQRLCNNAGIEPTLEKTDSEYCAHLLIKSQITGDVVEELNFSCDNLENIDIYNIVEVVNQ